MVAGILLACCVCAFALDPSLDLSQYAHTAWKVRDGFTKSGIETIAQTPDGYLWLGTELGLYRFDGVRAIPWPPLDQRLPSNAITSLLASRDGTLWIGTRKGLCSWKDGKLTQYPELAGAMVLPALEDRTGKVWFGTVEPNGRLCAITGGKAKCHVGTFGTGVGAIYEDHKGNLWVESTTGLWRWAPGPPQQYPFPRGEVEIDSLIEDESGVLLLAANDGLKQLKAGKIETYPLPGITGQFRPNRFLRSSDGSLWIGSQQGLLHLHQGRVDIFKALDGLSGDFIGWIFEDREGNLWVGTLNGLDRFREVVVPTISPNQGLSSSADWAVQATPDGSIWIGTADGLNRWKTGYVTVYRSRKTLSSNRTDERELGTMRYVTEIANSGLAGGLRSLGVDDSGQLWASVSDGVFQFEGGRFIKVPGVPGGNTLSIAGDSLGKVWILNSDAGLFLRTPKGAVQQIPWSRFQQKLPQTMLPDPQLGGLWLGFFEGGIAYLQDGEVRASYNHSNGLGNGRVTHFRFSPDGALWAATEGGLSRIKDGHIATLANTNGLPCDTVHWSMEDDDHDVWLYMPCGLVRLERSELDAWVTDPKHVLRTAIFDSFDGVRSIGDGAGYGPRVTKSPDGRIWFTPRDGVSVINPRHLPVNKLPPPVHIEQVTADRRTYDATNGLRLPPRVRDLAIDYTALSLVAPEKVHFRFKLEGQDKDWREVVNDRQVQYSNLPPKHYRFRVIASNNSGVWNETGDTLEFVIPPAWYQTNWFRALCVAAFLGLLWAAYQLRMRQLRYQFEMTLDARVSERTRIARDLHDTLLQSFQALLPLFQAAIYKLPEGAVDSRKTLEAAVDQASQAIGEGRDAVQGLRMSTVEKNDLAVAIRTVGEELAAAENEQTSTPFEVLVEGTPRTLHPILRDEVYRLAVEAMRNAFRHAAAHSVEVELRYDAKCFRMRVRDDGKGIRPELLRGEGREGHYGLAGMRERAKLVGGKLTIWTEVDSGTEIDLVIPASRAYEKSTRRFFFGERSATETNVKETIERE